MLSFGSSLALAFAGSLALAGSLPMVASAQTRCVANCIPSMPPCQGPVGGSGCPLPVITDCASWAASDLQQGIAQLQAMAASLPPSSTGDRMAQVLRYKEALETCASSKASAPAPVSPPSAPAAPQAAPQPQAQQQPAALAPGQSNLADPNLQQPLAVGDPSAGGGCGGLADGTVCTNMNSLFNYISQISTGSSAFQPVPMTK